jgi:hypothetical protein
MKIHHAVALVTGAHRGTGLAGELSGQAKHGVAVRRAIWCPVTRSRP